MIVARVRRTILERGLFEHGAHVLVGCSGGPDSAALLLALARLAPDMDLQLHAACVDHGLRPEAAADATIATRQASDLGIELRVLHVAVAPGASVQAQARCARYDALHALARELGAQRIAMGHTQDDQAETVLLRVLRGAGLRGLGAVNPARQDGVVRPLLDCSRAAVHQFAEAHFSEIARDSSNDQLRFERVRVRQQLLPTLLGYDASVVSHLAELADDARACIELLDKVAAKLLQQALITPETLRISVLREAEPVLRRAALRHWLVGLRATPGRSHLVELDHCIVHGRGEVWLPQRLCIRAHAPSDSMSASLL